jgi:hypothetical protein
MGVDVEVWVIVSDGVRSKGWRMNGSACAFAETDPFESVVVGVPFAKYFYISTRIAYLHIVSNR